GKQDGVIIISTKNSLDDKIKGPQIANSIAIKIIGCTSLKSRNSKFLLNNLWYCKQKRKIIRMLIKFRVTLITLVYVLSIMIRVSAQIQDSTSHNNPVKIDLQAQHLTNNYKLDYRQLIAPAVFIGFGVASLTNESLKELN